jgi:hypothetical protein
MRGSPSTPSSLNISLYSYQLLHHHRVSIPTENHRQYPALSPSSSLLVSRDPPRLVFSSPPPLQQRSQTQSPAANAPSWSRRGEFTGERTPGNAPRDVTGSSGSPSRIHQKEADWQRLSHFCGIESKMPLRCRVSRSCGLASMLKSVSNIQSVVSSCLTAQIVIHAPQCHEGHQVLSRFLRSGRSSTAGISFLFPSTTVHVSPNIIKHHSHGHYRRNTHTVGRENNSSRAGWAAQ